MHHDRMAAHGRWLPRSVPIPRPVGKLGELTRRLFALALAVEAAFRRPGRKSGGGHGRAVRRQIPVPDF